MHFPTPGSHLLQLLPINETLENLAICSFNSCQSLRGVVSSSLGRGDLGRSTSDGVQPDLTTGSCLNVAAESHDMKLSLIYVSKNQSFIYKSTFELSGTV